MFDRAADLGDLHAELGEVVGQPGFREHEQRLDAFVLGQGDDGKVETDGNVGEARLFLGAEVVVAEGKGRLGFAFPAPVVGTHRKPRNFGDGAAGLSRRIDDVAIEGCAAGVLEGQGKVGIFRAGQHEAIATDQGVRLGRAAHQAVQAVAVVGVDFAAIRADRLETQLLAIHLVANSEDVVAGILIECRNDFEIFPESFAQAESIKKRHGARSSVQTF